jgi:rubrerythrin
MSERGNSWALAALADDLLFEQEATKLYGRFATAAEDPAAKELFKELARGEAGHVRGIRRLIEMLAAPDAPVVFFCPLCGWQIDFGADPAEGTQGKCPMCPGRFALRLRDGDWTLDRLAP